MKRALMYASVASMIQQFNMENIRILLEQGYKVDVACNMEQGSTISVEKISEMKWELEQMGVECIHLPIPRKISAVKDIFASIKQTKKLISERGYTLVHCHSPIGGMICRLANCISGSYHKARMIYTAHGFHFYKGAPLKNWLLYYPVEWICSRFTDVLITINQEDYALAQKKMKAQKVVYIPGVGIDLSKFGTATVDKSAKRKELGIPDNATLLLSVGELNENKNHATVIRAIEHIPNVFYIIAGKGGLQEHLQKVIYELGLKDRVKLLGYRSDIQELCCTSDIFCFPSYREGLGLAALEAMACGLPLVTSNIHGINDYSEDGVTGFKCAPDDVDGFTEAINKLILDKQLKTKIGNDNKNLVCRFDLNRVNEIMKGIYDGK